MYHLSFHSIMGTLHESSEYKYQFGLTKDQLDRVLSQIDMKVVKRNGVLTVVDNDDQDDNPILGQYKDGILDIDVDIRELVDLGLLNEVNHLRRDGALDFRKLLGKATKKYQSMMVYGIAGTYSTPVVGDSGSSNASDSGV